MLGRSLARLLASLLLLPPHPTPPHPSAGNAIPVRLLCSLRRATTTTRPHPPTLPTRPPHPHPHPHHHHQNRTLPTDPLTPGSAHCAARVHVAPLRQREPAGLCDHRQGGAGRCPRRALVVVQPGRAVQQQQPLCAGFPVRPAAACGLAHVLLRPDEGALAGDNAALRLPTGLCIHVHVRAWQGWWWTRRGWGGLRGGARACADGGW